MGLESASDRIFKLYQRPHTLLDFYEAAFLLNKYKIKAAYDVIVDNPWETEEDVAKTCIFLSKLPPPFEIALYPLEFYPDTILYQKAKLEGRIKDDFKDVYLYAPTIKSTYLNKILLLLGNFTRVGINIPHPIMQIVTTKIVRKTKLRNLFYVTLYFCLITYLIFCLIKAKERVQRENLKNTLMIRINNALYTLYCKIRGYRSLKENKPLKMGSYT
jgi:radical SAM superfamily enzyme YgiQ (UPF0313 family)